MVRMSSIFVLMVLIFLSSCGAGNQSAVDDFFGTGNEDEASTGTLTYSRTDFREAIANDGSIENTITINLVGRLFIGAVGEEFVGSKLNVANLPSGLSVSAQFINDKEVQVTVTGNATNHADVDDINNVTFDFDDSAFNVANDIANKQTLVSVNYRDPYSLTYDKAIINESGANDGSFSEVFNVSVNDLDFSGNINEDFVANGKVTITNTPPGTTGTATKVGRNIIAVSLSGNSVSHVTSDDISNLTVVFNSPAFPSGVSAGVVSNTTRNNLSVNFFDPALLSYLPLSETFSESVANIGDISNQLTIHVTEDTFSGSIGENYILNGKAVVSNLPPGLNAEVRKITSTDVSVSLSGSAVNHTNSDDISNLVVNFSATAFDFNTNISNITNAQKSDVSVDFIDPYTLSFDTKNFLEGGSNDGSILTTISATLAGTDFTGNIGDELVSLGKVVVANIPSGLTATVIKSSANTASIQLSGNAINHESTNNISNISINFLDTAFVSGAAIGVNGSVNSDFSVQYKDPVSLSYSGSTFFESSANDGTISNEITVTLSNDQLTGVNTENFLSNGKAAISPSPVASGLTAVLERISNTELKLKLIGTATVSDVDIENITLTFDQSAFVTSSSIANINGAIKNNFKVDYIDVLTFSGTSVNERAQNDGQIDQSISLTLTGTNFTGSNGDELVGSGKVIVTNVPSGLSASIIRNSDLSATLSFIGTATSHEVANDVSNISIVFQNNAFASNNSANVTNASLSNFAISFLDPVGISYSGSSFVESVANDGSISNTITLTLSGDTFTGANGTNYIGSGRVTLSPAIPAGLTAELIKSSATTLEFSLTGNAAVHDIDQGPYTLSFDESAFSVNTDTTNIAGAVKNDFSINYNDALNFSTLALNERAENDGVINSTIVINLTGTLFTGSNSDDFLLNGNANLANLPVGLSATLVRNSNSQVVLSIGGSATSHTSSDDITNLTLTFNNSAFTNGDASSVANNTVNNISISYLDPVSLSYSSDVFSESNSNDGSITNSIDIDLTNDTFTGNNGDNFISSNATVLNVPVGLTASLIRINDTKLRLSLSGNASSNDIDISNLSLTINASAFTVTTNTVNVVNSSKTDLKINYYDLLSYSTKTLTERALNDGTITQTSNISITGTSFSGTNGEDFVASGKVIVSNMPLGLTPVITRSSSTQLVLSLNGVANNHESNDSITNLTISVLDSALSGSNSSSLENATTNDFSINFFDSVAISYSSGTFNEDLGNNGSIDNTITLTAVNDSYTGTNGEDFLANGKASIINLPAGLGATLTKISASVLQFNLTGNAIDHGDIHDVSNLSLSINSSALSITTDTTNVLNANKSDINIDYISPSSLVYDVLTFSESSSNDGSVANVINIDISGLDSFTGTIGDDFIAASKVSVTNIPAGFTASVIKTASKQVRFSLTGQAISHELTDSVSDIGIIFNSSALQFNNDISLVVNNSQSAIEVNYRDAASLSYSVTSLNESTQNTGAITETIDIDLTNDIFTGSNGENFLATGKVVLSNLPPGLSPSLEKVSATKVRLALTGNAVNHALANSVSNLTLNFQPSAFDFNTDVTTINNAQRNDLSINFLDPYQLTYSSGTFSETTANTGTLSGSSNISVTGTTFAGSINDNFVSNGFVTVSNLPAGLTAVVTKTASNQVVFTLTGSAINHANINDLSNLTLNFQSSAFASGNASGVLNSSKNDFIIDFNDPYSISFDKTSVSENEENIGTVTDTMIITLDGHNFSGSNGDDFILASRVNVTNVPSGLTARVIRNSATELELSFTGVASSHTNSDDISNISFELLNSSLVDGAEASDVIDYNPTNLSIDFIAPYTLSANGFSFDESSANDGTVTDTIRYTLVGTTFTGANGRDLYADGDVSLNNIPGGLTPVVTKIDDNNVELSFTSAALNHAVANNSSNTEINFLATAFVSNNENGVTPNSFSSISFDWSDPPSLSYTPSIFAETSSNIGETSTSVSIFATNKRFDGVGGENFVNSSKVTVSSYPAGLTPVVTYVSANQLTLTFTGAATNHANADDIATGLSVSFNDSAFEGGNAAQVVGGTYTSLGFDFIDPYEVNYASSSLSESSLNDGSINGSISISISGTLFTGAVNEDYASNSKAIVRNVPSGLTASVRKLSSSLIELTLTGNAANHEATDNISNLELELFDSAFASGAALGVNNYIKSDLSINFNDTASLSYLASTFNESVQNIGGIDNSITITVDKDTFSGTNGENFISSGKVTASNIPTGLIPQVIKTNDTTLTFSLTSIASSHENADDVSNVGISFTGNAFSFNSNPAAVTNSSKTDFTVDFQDAYQLSYVNSIFTESSTNDGSVGNTILVNLTGTSFTTGGEYVANGKATVSNLPAGLSAEINRVSATQVSIDLTGNASSHLSSNDISNLTVVFADTAFTSGRNTGVNGYSKNDLSVDFNDPPSIAYVGSNFSEAVSNIGSIDSTVDINLSGATFSGADSSIYTSGNEYSVSNVPVGLTAQVQKINSTTLRLSFTGSATNHTTSDSISNVGIQLNDNAFNTIAAANILNTSKSDYNMNFINPYSVSFTGSTFSEAAQNIGSISSSIDINLVGTSFTRSNGDVFVNGTDASFFNLPSGLTPRLEKINSNTIRLTLTGSASSHGLGDSITNFGITLLDPIFTSGAAAGVSNNTKIDFNINYIDPYTITYSGGTFVESNSNDGQISTSIDIDLVGTSFSGTNGSNYTLANQFLVANLPAGLTTVVFKVSNTKLRLFFTGSASSHENSDDISNFSITLNDSAFVTNAASGVSNNSKTDFVIDFVSAASLAYSNSTFNEAVSNIGEINDTSTITLTNDTFNAINGENLIASSKATISNLPAGLSASLIKVNDTTLTLSLGGQASSNLNSDDISNLTLSFNANAFVFNNDATKVSNYVKSDLVVDFLDQYTLAYTPSTFTEAAINDGSIGNDITITLTGSGFTTTVTDFISEGKATVTNVPAGLTASITRVNSTELTLSLTGNATNNLNGNDISNLTIDFADSAFTTGAANGVEFSTKSDIVVDFDDQPTISYVGSSFTEAASNIGAFDTNVVINLSGATFSGSNGDTYTTEYTISNVPAGLVAVVQKVNDGQVSLSFSSNASSHISSDNVSNITLSFNDSAFNVVPASSVLNNSKSDYLMTFRDPYSLSYSSNTFNEDIQNVGSIAGSISINLLGTTFTGTNGDTYSDGVQYSFANRPAGLTVQVQKVSDTSLNLSFTGNASSHLLADSISNFTLNMLDGAFSSGSAAGVSDTTKSDFAINFIDPYVISYSGASFSENGANDGSITDSIDIDLTGTSFSGSNGAVYTLGNQYSIANLPSGLTAVVTKINGTKLRLSFSGSATQNSSSDSVSNYTVILNNSAFTSNNANGVSNSSKNDFAINFSDNASIAYSGSIFNENQTNIGNISNAISLTLSSDTFTGLNGENYLATGKATLNNLPSGLTATLTKQSDTVLSLALSSTASSHLDSDDISNLELELSATAFNFNTDATSVTNYIKSDLVIDYLDPYQISYSSTVFTEASSNNGSIGNSLTISLSGGANFTTTASDFITEGKVSVSNLPAGLVASIVRDSATQITLSLTGNATNHSDVNDITNVRVNFADGAFTTGTRLGVNNYDISTISVDFNDQPSLSYSTLTLAESDENVGGFSGSIDISITGDTFTGANGDTYTGAKITYSNIPSGLTASIQKISDSLVRFSLSGNATAHGIINNISNLGVSFLNTAFTNVAAANVDNSNRGDISLSFKDPYILSYAGNTFSESLSNDGSISTSIDVTLSGTSFSGSNGAVYTNTNQYTQSNLPSGLNLVVTKINATTLRLTLSGNASAHANTNDISNLTINLEDSAFVSNSASGVNNSFKNDFVVDFSDPATLTYSTLALNESNANDGSVTETIDIDIIGDTFSGLVNSDLIANGDITVNNLPAGLTAVATKVSSTRLTVSLSGNASSHVAANNISNFGFTFLNSAFTNNSNAANVVNFSRSDLTFSFEDPYVLTYSALSFVENGTNNGSISDTITINLSGTTFTGVNGDDFAGSKAIFTNTPAGLTPVLTKDSSNQLTLSFTGSASSHTNGDDVSNFTITLQDSAFTSGAASGVDNSNVSTISIDFKDIAALAYSASTFNENISNTGSIDNSISLTLSGDSFNGSNGDNFIANSFASINNLPAGLTASLIRTSDTTATLSLSGSAGSHANGNDISNLEVIFNNTAFSFNTNASLVTNSTKSDLVIDFLDPYVLSYSGGSFSESSSNNGSISQTETITITGTSFSGTNGENFAGAKASVTNVPLGLTAELTRLSATSIELSFTGNAVNHENSHDVSNVTIIFNDSAFASGEADGVTGYSKSDIAIDFNDRPFITYGAAGFFESVANVGNIGTSLVITLANETFSAGVFNSSKVTVSNIPAGLSASFTRDTDTQLTMTLTGTAAAHANGDDISNLGLTFLDTAFSNVQASNITNSSKSDFNINYIDPYSLAFSTGSFVESLNNDGSISNSINITSTGVGFNTPVVDMIIDGMVSVSNIPAGLSASVVRNSASQVTFSLTGNASSHVNADDIANVSISFNDSAFTSNEADGVLNNSRANIVVDFQDPASLAYSGAVFNEALSNDGTISNTLDIDLSGDTFTGTNGENFFGTKTTVSNVPAGLTAVLNRISATKIRVSLTGSASIHANANDISNLSIQFLDSAFTNNSSASNVINYSRADIGVDFEDSAVISYSGSTFTESLGNNGSIGNTLVLTLSGDTFNGVNGEDFRSTSKLAITNVPTGLTATAIKSTNTTITVSLTGSAAAHANADDISNLTFSFANSAFSNNVAAANVIGSSRADLIIDFQDPATLSYSSSLFNEALSNDGLIDNDLILTLNGDSFTGSNGEDFIVTGKVSVANVPTGLTLTATRDSNSQITLGFAGSADNHVNSDDVSNLTITFNNTAFTNNSAAANVTNYSRNDLAINFNDPAVIAYGGSNFSEALLNDGAISNNISITISGDSFDGVNGENFISSSKVTVSNVPGGLAANLTKISDTELQFSLNGNASSHVDANDISNLTLTFTANAFTGNTDATNVVNYSKNDFSVDFNDPYNIVYSLAGFIEAPATDDGSIDGPLIMSVEGTTFTGANGDDFAGSKVIVSNVPPGLTARIVRTSNTALTFYLDGNASPHNDTADISNLTVSFQDSAFAINNSGLVANAIKNDLVVDFYVTPVNAPSDIAISDSTVNSATITWTDNASNEARFIVERCNGAACDTAWSTDFTFTINTPNTTAYTYTGLTEGSYYRFRVKAENDDTDSPYVTSDLAVIFGGGTITDNGEGTSQEFRDMNCYGVAGTYAVMTWNDIGANNYLIYDHSSGSPVLRETISGTKTSYVIDTLDLGVAQNFRVVASMGSGVFSQNSATTDFTTSATFVPCNIIGNDAGTYHATKPTGLYDPRGSFVYDGKLFVSDRNNARVLIYDSVPANKDATPDVVLGQDRILDESSNVVGITNVQYNDAEYPPEFQRGQLAANMLRCPEGIWVGDVGGTVRVMVADSCAHRVLIWNGIPTSDNADADLVIGKTNFTNTAANFPNRLVGMSAPYDVTSDGTRVAVADYNNRRIMVWNTFPTVNGQAPSLCLGATSCANAGISTRNAKGVGRPRSVLIASGKLLTSTPDHDRVTIFNDVTSLSDYQDADVVIGQTSLTAGGNGTGANKMRDPWGLTYDAVNGKLYIADTYNCRIKVYNSIPTANDASSDYVLGTTNTGRQCGFSQTRLHNIADVAVDPANDKVYVPNYGQDTIDVYSSIPSATGASKAFAIGTHAWNLGEPNYGSDDASGTKSRFLGVHFDVASDQFFATDSECDRVLVWNSAPVTANQEPDYVLGQPSLSSCNGAGRAQNRFNEPRGMCTVDGKLWIADYNNRRVMIYDLPITSNQPGASGVLGQTSFTAGSNHGAKYPTRPYDCFQDSGGKIMVSNYADDNVLVYDTTPIMGANITDHQADFQLGIHASAGRTQQRMTNPYGVTANGTNIFVADRSNGRVLIFPYPTSDSPNAVGVLGQLNYTLEDTDRGNSGIREPTGIMIVNNRLYVGDRSFQRLMYWNLPIPNEFYQAATGLYGHGGDYDYGLKRSSHELQELEFFDIASDGKRIFGVDLTHGTIVISPLRQN